MYEVTCDRCGKLDFHPSRIGAESLAERHAEETDHDVSVSPMGEA